MLSAVIVLLASTMFANGSLFAQDWNGRRYITENSELCHQVIMQELAKDKDFRDGAAAEKDALITILAMTDIRIGIAFKSKNRFLFSVMMNINNQLASKAGIGREEIEQANNRCLSVRTPEWKYIPPSEGPDAYSWAPGAELGYQKTPQLYRISTDPGEQENVAEIFPDIVSAMQSVLDNL